jgi:diacylglycerol kinase family enzyme
MSAPPERAPAPGPRTPIPAFVNREAGSGERAADAIAERAEYRVVAAEPSTLAGALRAEVDAGTRRVLVAGGDGTLATAAGALAGSRTELAIVPAGTLNHFARDLGIPTDPAEAAALGAAGEAVSVDIGRVNDRVFLNTSSVGSYVLFVRTRERLEPYLGYTLASLFAGLRLLGRVRPFSVHVDVDGEVRRYHTALVFIAIGERELRVPLLGRRVPGGRRGLHVMIVRGGTTARLVAAGLVGLARGLRAVARGPLLDSFLADQVRIEMRRPRGTVAVDGELAAMVAPLEYRIERGALEVVASY